MSALPQSEKQKFSLGEAVRLVVGYAVGLFLLYAFLIQPFYIPSGSMKSTLLVGDRLIVSPRFHRLHHALANANEPHIHDHNFAPVLPLWDILFGTVIYEEKARPTGVDDPSIDADNERGWLGQQIVVFGRFAKALVPRFKRA